MNPLVAENVSRYFGGVHALEDVSLEAVEGERRAILGPNGAGKTTLFNVICGQVAATSGRISLFGRDVTAMPPYKRAALGLARTFQITSLFPNLTVMESLLLAVQARERAHFVLYEPFPTHRHIAADTDGLIDRWGLTDERDTLVRNISYGHQRQLEMAMALAANPKLLLLDEPTAGLSAAETQEMTNIIKALDRNVTVLLIEHDMDVAFQLADWVTVLDQGRVLADGPPAEVRNDPNVVGIYLRAD